MRYSRDYKESCKVMDVVAICGAECRYVIVVRWMVNSHLLRGKESKESQISPVIS